MDQIRGQVHERYAVQMNIAVSRAFGALRVIVPKRELEKDEILKRVAELANGLKDAKTDIRSPRF